eukprot:2261757-Rhodomonas_salina.1
MEKGAAGAVCVCVYGGGRREVGAAGTRCVCVYEGKKGDGGCCAMSGTDTAHIGQPARCMMSGTDTQLVVMTGLERGAGLTEGGRMGISRGEVREREGGREGGRGKRESKTKMSPCVCGRVEEGEQNMCCVSAHVGMR